PANSVSLSNNIGMGAALVGDGGNVTATLKNCSVGFNQDQGILVRQGATFTTTVTLDGNDVFNNNSGAGRAAGGIFFATPSTVAGFTANKIHGNNGDEIAVDAQPNGGDTWNLSGAAACSTPNQIYCYGAPSVGLRILDSAPPNTKVNAAGTSWTNLVPVKGTDFQFDMTKFDVMSLPACSAVTATCN
ncbi:MAG TPA: hypothetical protein VN914_07295, partial [Polyangia bacterium]|nr:hypothetical protein [Polyangia bacterium]